MSAVEEHNWVSDEGGLPSYVRRIVRHLKEKGMDESRAIATAVNVVKKMCSSGDTNFPGLQQVNAGSRAEACAAVADWERKKADRHGKHSAPDDAIIAVMAMEDSWSDWARDLVVGNPTLLAKLQVITTAAAPSKPSDDATADPDEASDRG